jgi:uncharacterized protein involved in exopolysaccharide biosynthesis
MVDFAGMWQALQRRWWVPLLTGALLTGGAGYWMMKSPRFYTSVAVVAVNQQQSTFLPGESFAAMDLKSLEILKSIETQIVSQSTLLRVANEHRMREDPVFAKPKNNGPYNDDEIAYLMGKRVTAALDRGTRLIKITVDDTDAQRSKDICESILSQAMRQSTDTDRGTAQLAKRSLTEEKIRIEAKLLTSQKAVDERRRQPVGFPAPSAGYQPT